MLADAKEPASGTPEKDGIATLGLERGQDPLPVEGESVTERPSGDERWADKDNKLVAVQHRSGCATCPRG